VGGLSANCVLYHDSERILEIGLISQCKFSDIISLALLIQYVHCMHW